MKAFQIIDDNTVTEPVTLAEVKNFSYIDDDYNSNDADLNLMITTARIRLEAYTNIGFAERDVSVIWPGNKIELPLSPTSEVISVTKNQELVPLDADKYTVDIYPAKSIYINSLSGITGNWFYPIGGGAIFTPDYSQVQDAYTVVYTTGYTVLPYALKQAILAEVDALFKLKGQAPTEVISPNAAMIAKPYSRNLVL